LQSVADVPQQTYQQLHLGIRLVGPAEAVEKNGHTSEKAEQNRYQRHLAHRIRPPLYVQHLTAQPQRSEPIPFLRQRLMAE
jgi:hypothetical protein